MDNLLNQICKVKRANVFKGKERSNKFYIDLYEDEEVGTYPCRIIRKSPASSAEQVNSTVQGTMRAYFRVDADVKEGDIIECDEYYNYTFKTLFVYKPNSHHIEADLEIVPKDV